MNVIDRAQRFVSCCMVEDFESRFTARDGTYWLTTDLEFLEGVLYRGSVYNQLRVTTINQLSNTMPIRTFIMVPDPESENGWRKIDDYILILPFTLVENPLVHHKVVLEDLIATYIKRK